MKKESKRNFEKVCEIIDKYEKNPTKLIPILQEVQEEYRYLPEEVMAFVATCLKISPAKVYAVATFYSHFTLVPKGKYVLRVCDGTACHVKKSTYMIDAIREKLQLKENQSTTTDMMFTLEIVSCIGACGLAPAIVINENIHGLMTPESVVSIIDKIVEEETKNK